MFFELEHWEKCCEWTSKAETSLILPADREKTLHEAGISPCMLAAVSGGLRTGFSAIPGDQNITFSLEFLPATDAGTGVYSMLNLGLNI